MRYYLVEVPGSHPIDSGDLGELEAFALDRLHAQAIVREVQLDTDLNAFVLTQDEIVKHVNGSRD